MSSSIYDLQTIFFDTEACLSYLFDNEILYRHPICRHHHRPMVRYGTKWRCTRSGCGHQVSVYRNSIFSQSRIPINKFLFVAYLWVCKAPITTIQIITGHTKETIIRIVTLLRQVIATYLEVDVTDEDYMIGGPGIVVEIDETKLCKSHDEDDQEDTRAGWVFGGVERTDARRMFVERVENRSADTLLEIIGRRVHPDSAILSDCWAAYNLISSRLNIDHMRVNHSVSFVDSATGAHTNTIEGTWRGLKFAIPNRSRAEDRIDGHLFELMWRRRSEGHVWESLLECLRDVSVS